MGEGLLIPPSERGTVKLAASRSLPRAGTRRDRGGAAARAAGLVRAHATTLLTALAVTLFGALCFYQYRLPGLYYDEAFDAVPAMQLLQGRDVPLLRGVGLHVFGRDLPVMIGDYWGVVSTYALLPLFWLLGVDVLAIRLWPIGAGLLSIALTAALGRRLFGQPVGLLAAFLLAIFPSFIFWSRVGIYVIAHIVAVSLGIMLAYLLWRERSARRYLFLAGLLTGIGLSTKLLFLWFLIAVPAAYVVLLAADALFQPGNRAGRSGGVRQLGDAAWSRLRADIPIRGLGDPLVAGAGFVLGAFPVLYYNLVSRGSYLVLRANLFQTERGVDNFALWSNLKIEADALRVLLNGGYFWFYGGIYQNSLYPWVAGVSVVGLLTLVHTIEPYRRYRRPVVFLLAFAAVIFVLSCFTVSILGATHLLILLPIPQLMIAAFAVHGGGWAVARLAARPQVRPLVWGAVALVLATLAARDLWVDVRYHQALSRSGGVAAFSDGIYQLAEELERAGVRQPYALDWGMKYNLMILTEGHVEPLEIFGPTFETNPEFEQAVLTALREPDPVFIALSEESATYRRIEDFRRLVAASGRAIRTEQTILERSGRPVYHIFRVT